MFDAVCQVRAPDLLSEAKHSAEDLTFSQGLLYVLCYRMEMIADSGASALTQLRALPMER